MTDYMTNLLAPDDTDAVPAPKLVAIDDGYAQTKLYGEGPDGKPIRFGMRSSARQGRYGLSSITGASAVGCYETEEGDQFTVSEDIEAEDTKFDGFHLSPMNRVLVSHALWAAGYGGKEVRIISGLPVADFFLGDDKDQEKIAAKTANLMKGVKLTSSDSPLARIVGVRIGCQAVAAWVDHVVDDGLQFRQDTGGAIAIVDIGGRTTDIATVVGGASIDHSKSGTENIGVLDVYNAVGAGLRGKFKTRDRFPLAQIDAAVRHGKIKLWGSDQDVSDIVKAAVHENEAKIAREVERRIGSGAILSAIVFVGGGSALFKTISQHFPNGVMAEDPEFANARGLYKFMRLQAE
jgi:plasmid segregation protein ParM